MDDTLLKLLRTVDTPTVCNAIEVAQGQRGFNAFTRGTMISSDPEAPAIVGYAVTAKIQALTPPTEAPEVIQERRMDLWPYGLSRRFDPCRPARRGCDPARGCGAS